MTKGKSHSKDQLEKIGNAIIYLASRMNDGMGLTKKSVLKLLFILEERSIRKNHLPFFNLQYAVWKFGPVAVEVHSELRHDTQCFKDYFEQRIDHKNVVNVFSPIAEFNDDEFTLNDITIMDEVIAEFGNHSEKDLIEYTHREDSLWYKAAVKKGVLEDLLSEVLIQTDIQINFTDLFTEDEADALDHYKSHLEFLKISDSLK